MNHEIIKKHLVFLSIILAEALGFLGTLFLAAGSFFDGPEGILYFLIIAIMIGLFFVYPFILTALNLYFLVHPLNDPQWNRKGRYIEYITVVLGTIYSCLVHLLLEIQYKADWDEVLVNDQMHTPIWTEGALTVAVLSAVGILGYLFLSCIHVNKVPPLITVLAMAAMYLGVLECAFWIVQVIGRGQFMLCLFPFNCIVLAAKTIRRLIYEWKQEQEKEVKTFRISFLRTINEKLTKSDSWPLAAFLFMWPLLGTLIGVLVLLGQQPDAVIRAWTETSDWNLSRRVAPQNVYYDEHYLCTVAAGGHENVVKPLRLGERHGHPVIVNRQLCVANAFEQILEEKTPKLHRHVRHFYDTYGFPVAKMIHSTYMADLIYYLMKPLEWIFLIVLYLTDIAPENRIAMQYMPPQEAAKLCRKMRRL